RQGFVLQILAPVGAARESVGQIPDATMGVALTRYVQQQARAGGGCRAHQVVRHRWGKAHASVAAEPPAAALLRARRPPDAPARCVFRPTRRRQALGSVTPCWPWYLPPRSL